MPKPNAGIRIEPFGNMGASMGDGDPVVEANGAVFEGAVAPGGTDLGCTDHLRVGVPFRDSALPIFQVTDELLPEPVSLPEGLSAGPSPIVIVDLEQS